MGATSLFSRPVDGALYLLRRGFKVFPIQPNTKNKPIYGWQKWAENSTEDMVRAYAAKYETANWGVYCGPSELIVLDVDPKNGGDKSLKDILSKNAEFPKTLTVRTPSGGLHIYFKGKARSSVSKIAKGLDTRGVGGYVVAAGSRVDGKIYEVIEPSEVASAPKWLLTALEKPIEHERPEVLNELLIQEGERNQRLFEEACSARARGYGENAIFNLIKALNEEQTVSPLHDSEIELIVAQAMRYAPNAAKAASDFTPIKIEDLRVLRGSDVDPDQIPFRDWVMKDRYVSGYISTLISKGGVGKSTLTMLDGVAITTGDHLGVLTGYQVLKKTPVWIYNLEDPLDEMQRKITAIRLHHKIDADKLKDLHLSSGQDNPFKIVSKNREDRTNYVNQPLIDTVVKYINDNAIGLFIVDPFIMSHTCNENDNVEINEVLDAYKQIIRRTGCGICLVHHARKPNGTSQAGESATARGASSLIDACRISHTLTQMTKADAENTGIKPEDFNRYVRLDPAKSNLSRPPLKADWFKLSSIAIGNKKPNDPDFKGDSVGVMSRVDIERDFIEIKKRETLTELEANLEALVSLVPENTTVSLNDIFDKLNVSDVYSHLISRTKRPDNFIRRLKALMGDHVHYVGLHALQLVVYEKKYNDKYYVKHDLESQLLD